MAALISAEKENKSVEELTAFYNARQREDFESLGIRFDIYGGTHQPGLRRQARASSVRTSSAKIYEEGLTPPHPV